MKVTHVIVSKIGRIKCFTIGDIGRQGCSCACKQEKVFRCGSDHACKVTVDAFGRGEQSLCNLSNIVFPIACFIAGNGIVHDLHIMTLFRLFQPNKEEFLQQSHPIAVVNVIAFFL